MVDQCITVRQLMPSDSLERLTGLLHAAYRELADQGMNFTATDQTVETTAYRVAQGTCFVALEGEDLVGTALLVTMFDDHDPARYRVGGTGVLSQFGVRPDRRGLGLGDQLLGAVEDEARARGLSSLCLDTAEPARHLFAYYAKRGFAPSGRHQWPGKTYASIVMEKPLAPVE